MEEASIPVDRVQFGCPICLELLRDPVTIPCGHSFCMTCIMTCWDHEVDSGGCRCPHCRQTFTPRPALGRNTILADMVVQLKSSGILTTAVSEEECSPGAGEVACGSCVGRKRKAEKSCLVCLDSYCQTHFERHEELHPGKRHKVVDAINMEEKTCSAHGKLLEVFCRTDQKCVCLTCVTDDHKGHDIISAEAGKNEKKVQLKSSFLQQIQKRESELQALREVVEPLKSSAQTAVKESEEMLAKLVDHINQTCSMVTQLIQDQEQAECSRAEDLAEQVEELLSDLRRRDTELDQLPHTEDHISGLQSLLSLAEEQKIPSISISQRPSFGSLKYLLESMIKNVTDCCEMEMQRFSREVGGVFLEAKTRDDMLMYFKELTLDKFTAFRRHNLCDEYTKVKWSDFSVSGGDGMFRFSKCKQVLCNEGLSGRAYWEVEWSGGGGISVAVAYDTMNRKGFVSESGFGNNDESWALQCYHSNFGFRHAGREIIVPGPSSDRIGIYLDYEAGLLAFYSISNKKSTLLHKVHTIFSKPLYPGFYVDSWAELTICKQSAKGRRW